MFAVAEHHRRSGLQSALSVIGQVGASLLPPSTRWGRKERSIDFGKRLSCRRSGSRRMRVVFDSQVEEASGAMVSSGC
jgi:hypothetical protein